MYSTSGMCIHSASCDGLHVEREGAPSRLRVRLLCKRTAAIAVVLPGLHP